jgi:hypothetical protein
MKAIVAILSLLALVNAEKVILSAKDLQTGRSESLSGDFVSIITSEPRSEAASFKSLLAFAKSIKVQTMIAVTFESTLNPKTYQSVFLWNPSEQIVGFNIQAHLGEKLELLSLQILKSDNKKIIDNVNFKRTDELQAQIFDGARKSGEKAAPHVQKPSQTRPDQQTNSQQQQPNSAPVPPPEEQTFFKKYFWYIVIGGILIMNFMSSGKGKLGEAYAQAQQQAQTTMNTPRP